MMPDGENSFKKPHARLKEALSPPSSGVKSNIFSLRGAHGLSILTYNEKIFLENTPPITFSVISVQQSTPLKL